VFNQVSILKNNILLHFHIGSSHLFETVKAATNLLPYSKQEFVKGIQWKNITQIRLKFRKLSFWVLVPFGPLWPLLSQKQWELGQLLLTNAGRKFHKESKEKKNIKIILEIKSQKYGCWSLLALSNLGNGKSYNSVAIFQTWILVVGPILETVRVIQSLLEH